MNDSQCAEDPDPLPVNRTGALFVPARPGPAGYCARLFRTPLGARTAVAFTDERQLIRTLGQQQTWIRLSEPAVRALVAPLGVVDLTIDPLLAAPGPGAPPLAGPGSRTGRNPQRTYRPSQDPRAVGALRASGTPSLFPASIS
ncbi:SAV_915 family protein [Streptomyces sp. BE230]|uniref:SAV_915 family protein n=1 Tax=Streptomyces sp. BE230 TaxID=3002526 RepID=UPI002ED40B00|nr:SAV_915 family protein [Streptomyces sp. BE230]